jgi:hypothetical protein
MTLAVRAVVELFRAVRRKDELNRKILAFSISYDNTSVRIYGHYPVISAGNDVKYYRHPIYKFDGEMDGISVYKKRLRYIGARALQEHLLRHRSVAVGSRL